MSGVHGLVVERDGSVGRCLIDRPESRNALSPDLLNRLREAVADLAADPGVLAIVITGRGGSAFSSGYDVDAIGSSAADLAEAGQLVDRCATEIESASKPVIAVVRGYCLGAALEIALGCDLRLGASDSYYAVPSARLGLLLPLHYVRRLERAIGPSQTSRLLLLGERVPASEAAQVGLLHATVDPAQLDAALTAWLKSLAQGSPAAIAATKRVLRLLDEAQLASAGALERSYATLASELAAIGNHMEGITAFKERRRPRYSRPK